MGRYFSVLALLSGLTACSTTFNSKPCTSDTDCGADVCELRGSASVCVSADDATINLGQSAPFSGVNAALGTGMNNGIQLAINALDDGYDPEQAQANAMTLTAAIDTGMMPTNCSNTPTPVSNGATPAVNIPVSVTALDRGPAGVLALLGSVGTPTAVRAAPVATETHTLFYGPFTGAGSPLRDGSEKECQKYIFNVRASYAEEGVATEYYFQSKSVPITGTFANLISFDQNDSFGNAGYLAMQNAWLELNNMPTTGTLPNIARFRYTRNDPTTVAAALTGAEAYITSITPSGTTPFSVGIQMTDVYSIGASFIEGLRQWQFGATGPGARLTLVFSNISFVGADALAGTLKTAGPVQNGGGLTYTQNVLVSQVVPNYQTNTAEIVTTYNKLAQAAGQPGNFTALEGYIATKIFIQGLLQVNGPITPDSMIPALENLPNLSLGLGATAGFSATNHQYLDSVWGTEINPDGTFSDTYYWTVSPSTAPLGTYMAF